VIAAGTTILIPTGAKSHLFVAVYDPQSVSGVQKVLLVPFGTVIPKCDQACLVDIGEHPFIDRPSFMNYHHSRNELLSHVIQCLTTGGYQQGYPAVSNGLLVRIQAGYSATNRVPRHVKNEWPSRLSLE
jgi:hypothetical protein